MKQSRYIVCPSCEAMNATFDATCDQCGAPLSGSATAISVQPQEGESKPGFRPPRTIVLLGIWMIFLPNFFGTTYTAFLLMRHRDGLAEFIAFWGEVGLTCLSFVILFLVTKHYFFRPARITASVESGER